MKWPNVKFVKNKQFFQFNFLFFLTTWVASSYAAMLPKILAISFHYYYYYYYIILLFFLTKKENHTINISKFKNLHERGASITEIML